MIGNISDDCSGIEIQNISNLNLKNNIFANQSTGYALKYSGTISTLSADKNSFFTQGNYLFKYNNQSFQKLNQWITVSGQDINSKNINPFYDSDTNLTMNQIQLNNNADAISGITIDIDSTSRTANNDIGAKIFTPCVNDAGIDSIIGMIHNLSNTTMPIKGLLQNHGTATLNSVSIYFSVNGITQPAYLWSGSLVSGATVQVNLGNFTFSAAQSNLKIWTSQPNGSADCNNYNDTAKFFRINGSLCGIYYIAGLNPDFPTIADAAYALNGVGISCPVTFRVRDTVFNQTISIGPVKGNSFINSITFERDTFLTNYPGLNYTASDTVNDFVLQLDSTTHVTFRNLCLTRQNGDLAVRLSNLNNYTTFDNCKMNGLRTDTLGLDSVLVINNCEFQNKPINIYGDSIKHAKNIFINNTIDIWKSNFQNLERLLIDSCRFYYSAADWNPTYNILFENCKEVIMSKCNTYVYNDKSNSLIIIKSESINFDNNIINSECYNFGIKAFNIEQCKKIKINSNIINTFHHGDCYWGCNPLVEGIYAEKSSDIKISSNQINNIDQNNNNVQDINFWGIHLVDSVFKVNIDTNIINGFNTGIECHMHSIVDSIAKNSIYNVISIGIQISGDSAVVQKNKIFNTPNITGIHILCNNAKIIQNRMYNLTESEGIRVKGQRNLIANNFIHIGGYGVARGIVADTGSDYSRIIHNSINICSTDPLKGKAFVINGGNNFQVKNNIFSNKGSGFATYFNNFVLPVGMSTGWNTNSYYSPTYKIGYYNGTNYNNVINWNSVIGSGADYGYYNPYFATDTNTLPYQRFLNGAAIAHPNVVIDIDDTLRNAQAPDIGADEFKVDFGITQMLSPSLECVHGTNDSVTIYIKQYGDIPFTDIPLAYTINNGTVVFDTVSGSIFNDITHSFPLTINISPNNTYVFKIWIIDAYDDNKVNDTLIAIRYSKPAPIINFSAPTYCENLNTNFTSQAIVASPYTIASYQWHFGDGDSALLANPVHIYDSIGIYQVKLRVYSSAGCFKDTLKSIVIHATPNAEFTTGSQCMGVPVIFTNNSIISTSDSLLYNWNFGDNTNSIQKNPSHTYNTTGNIPVQLITTSNFGCNDSILHNVNVHTLPVIQLNKQNISCNGLTDGKITATVTSGNPSYQYLWSNTASTNVINNLSTGTYILTVIDSMGCVDKDTAVIIQPGAMVINFIKKSFVCDGMNNGWIKASVNAGTHPYTYNWNGGLIGDSIYNLNNGTYFLTVSDSNNCQKTDSITISSKPQPNLQFIHTDNICYGGNTGTASVIASNGQIPYTFQWLTTPIQTTQNIQNLVNGYYTAIVTDSFGCINLDSIFINQPDSFHFTIDYILPLCYGDSNGIITVLSTGATAPYSYLWNTTPVQINSTASNLPAGNYQLIVSDNNNCDTTLHIILNQPSLLNVQTITKSESCENYCNGMITAIVNGGISPYTYIWNTNPIQTDSIAINLCKGTYEVTVIDSNNCTVTHQAAFIQTNTITQASFTLIPDHGFTPLDVTFTFTGIGAATYSWDFGNGNTSSLQNPMNIFNVDGIHHIVLIASSGAPDFCSDTSSFDLFVDRSSEIKVSGNFFSPNGDGINDFFYPNLVEGIKEIKVSIYNRWGAEIYIIESVSGKWDGNYLNDPAPEGVYYYILKAKGIDGKEYEKHGSVTLLR
jgi:gliding motility-associated-like protein